MKASTSWTPRPGLLPVVDLHGLSLRQRRVDAHVIRILERRRRFRFDWSRGRLRHRRRHRRDRLDAAKLFEPALGRDNAIEESFRSGALFGNDRGLLLVGRVREVPSRPYRLRASRS